MGYNISAREDKESLADYVCSATFISEHEQKELRELYKMDSEVDEFAVILPVYMRLMGIIPGQLY
jgi:hypothetical protein